MSALKFSISDSDAYANRWNSIMEMWHQEMDCDVSIVCQNNQVVKAHGLVLRASSFAVKTKNEIHAPFCKDIVYKVVQFCYTGTLEIECDEFVQCLKVLAMFQGEKLFESIEGFFGENVQRVPQNQFNEMPTSCVRSFMSKSLMDLKFWTKRLLEWMRVDKDGRMRDYVELMDKLLPSDEDANPEESISSAYQDFCEMMRNESRADDVPAIDSEREITEESGACTSSNPAMRETEVKNRIIGMKRSLEKRVDFTADKPFYFTWHRSNRTLYKFDGKSITPAQGFRDFYDETKGVIVVSEQKKYYLEVREDKSMFIKGKKGSIKGVFKVLAYSLNPNILALDDGRFVRVIDSDCDQPEQMFQELPELQKLIPKIPSRDFVHYMQIVNGNIFLLSEDPGDVVTDMFVLDEGVGNHGNGWRDVRHMSIAYLDIDDQGGLGAWHVNWDDMSISRLIIENKDIRFGDEIAWIPVRYAPLPFISSGSSMVGERDYVFHVGKEHKWRRIGVVKKK